MNIRITALDTLFFKDGKPFSMGDETWADGIFPPPPSVIYGALRTAFFGENISELSKANEDNDPTLNLHLLNLCYSIGGTKYYPSPRDLVLEGKDKKLHLLSLSSKKLVSNYLMDSHFTTGIKNVESADDYLISNTNLIEYLNGKAGFGGVPINEIVTSEPKIGIGRDRSTRTASEGKLYRVGMRRLESSKREKLSLEVEFDGFTLSDSGCLKLGAEGKVSHYSNSEDANGIGFPFVEAQEVKKFKIYLLTPAFFENGSEPDLKKEPWSKLSGIKLISAANGKPISIGGFDMKKRIPKEMMKAVPAGSVYYFESADDASGFIKEIHGKSISEYRDKEGFGICYVGKV